MLKGMPKYNSGPRARDFLKVGPDHDGTGVVDGNRGLRRVATCRRALKAHRSPPGPAERLNESAISGTDIKYWARWRDSCHPIGKATTRAPQ